MKKDREQKLNKHINKTRTVSLLVIICDVVLLIAFVASIWAYTSQNNKNNYNQNVENIESISKANSQFMQIALQNTSDEMQRVVNFCDGEDETEVLDYLSLINAETQNEYQILKYDELESVPETYPVFYGYSTKKDEDDNYIQVLYENTVLSASLYNNMNRENKEIVYSQSFTNSTDGLRYFSVYSKISIIPNGETQPSDHFIIRPTQESTVLAHAQRLSQYKNFSIAMCYTDGTYLAYDSNFRSNNFFDYLYRYNNWSLDQKQKVMSDIKNDEDGEGVLTFKNFRGDECVFAYAVCDNLNNWFIVVSVPVDEFVSPEALSVLPLIIIAFLVVLLVFNVYGLLNIVKKFKESSERERDASLAKGSFLSRMSHEIRTPLNAVIGYNTIAMQGISDAKTPDEIRQAEMKTLDCLEKSGIASKHLLTIINDVLDMSSIESGKIKISHDKFDFKGLVTSLTTVFYSQARQKGVNFEVLFDTLTEEWFVGDQMRTNQILTNLLSNAIKFTPEGGLVTLRIYQPNATLDACKIHFEVSDTGIGMKEEYLHNIWKPFEQADSSISRRFGGTGLGLSITKNLVDLMGGSIAVSSVVGRGTKFDVELTFEPVLEQIAGENYDFSKINALVVDDDESTCNYIRLLFNRCGAKCTTVTSGEQAVEAVYVAMREKQEYSLCLVDWQMPKMDGIETIERINQISEDKLPTVVLTAYDFSEIDESARKIGVKKFISKPLFQSSLFDLLVNICGIKAKAETKKTKKIDFNGLRVLLAEDNEMNMEIAKEFLTTAGIVVDCGWNGKEVVEMLENSAPGTYKAILMDVHMPEMNGLDATRAIRASTHKDAQSIPIIAMTADAFAENVAEALQSGMNDHIAKPIDIAILYQILEKYLNI